MAAVTIAFPIVHNRHSCFTPGSRRHATSATRDEEAMAQRINILQQNVRDIKKHKPTVAWIDYKKPFNSVIGCGNRNV